ncbi:MAG: cytochrome c oxidase assembly protein, partial [Candidatus Binatia bacterium]
LDVKYPDANSLSALLFDWDEDRLNALAPAAQREILAKIDQLNWAGKIPTIAGKEEFSLIREGRNWRIFFDWAAGVHVRYSAVVPPTQPIAAVPVNEQTTIRPGELFTIAYRVKNRTDQPLSTRIVHRIEPQELRQHLDIIECALLLPVKLLPGQESEFSTTYMMRSDFPEGPKELKVTYEFQVSP